MAIDRITTVRTLRLLIHLPRVSGDRAVVSFMNVKTTRGIPHAHTSLHTFLTNADADPSDPVALHYIARAHDVLLQQVQR